VQRAAAARAGLRHRVDHALARQVLGQRPARRLASVERLHGDLLDLLHRLGLGYVFLELEQLQLELHQEGATLGRLAEPLVAQLGDRVLQLLDQ
jgi:hypothetical protein